MTISGRHRGPQGRDSVTRALLQSVSPGHARLPQKRGPESLVFLWMAHVPCCENRSRMRPLALQGTWCRGQAPPLLWRTGAKAEVLFYAGGEIILTVSQKEKEG